MKDKSKSAVKTVIDEEALFSIVEKAKKYDELVKPFPNNKQVHCSFCGKSQSQLGKLIAGPQVYICNECVDLCHEIIHQEEEKENGTTIQEETSSN